MKVLHVIPSMEAEHGGPTVALDGIVRGIAARGVEVTVATTARSARRQASELAPGITLLRFPRSLPGSWKYSRQLGVWLLANLRTFDIAHVHALFSYATIPACRSAIRQQVPLVVRPLGTLDPWCLDHRSWKKRPYLRLVERQHLDGAAAIHVTSELERRSVDALGYGAKARVIPLGVEISAGTEAPAVRERAAHRDSLNLLFLSRLHPKKGLPLLIAALGGLRDSVDFTLRIAGSGSAIYEADLRRLCVHEGIAERVTFYGHVEGVRKAELFDWADVFVLPSHQENFSLAAVEAMAAGLPVVLSEHVGVAPDVGAAGAGLIVPLKVAAVADAIRHLATDHGLRLRMGLAGRALVQSRFTWASAADALLNLYRELRGGDRPATVRSSQEMQAR